MGKCENVIYLGAHARYRKHPPLESQPSRGVALNLQPEIWDQHLAMGREQTGCPRTEDSDSSSGRPFLNPLTSSHSYYTCDAICIEDGREQIWSHPSSCSICKLVSGPATFKQTKPENGDIQTDTEPA